MSTRSTRRNPVETPIENIPSELLDEPIRRPRKPKASIPNLEYIPDPDLPPCETDEDGLKGQTFLNFMYNQLKQGTTTETPKVYIMMGPPGAGKSTIKKSFNIDNYVNIDLDEIKKICMNCFPGHESLTGFRIIGNLIRFAKQLTEMAIKERMNILFDTTGKMTDLVKYVLDATKSENYRQIFIIIYTSLENCIERGLLRNALERTRVSMSSSDIENSYMNFMKNKASEGIASYYLIANKELTEEADELHIFDNNNSSPQILFRRVDGIIEDVNETPDFYNMTINTSEPYFTLKTRRGGRTRRRKRGNKKTRKYH